LTVFAARISIIHRKNDVLNLPGLLAQTVNIELIADSPSTPAHNYSGTDCGGGNLKIRSWIFNHL